MRQNGILLPISALPSPYGIGCFSKEAYDFIDRLKEAGQTLWQILPLGPTSYGDSPYQSFSTFAGNPYFIDLKTLIDQELLTEELCDSTDFGDQNNAIDYGKLYQTRFQILKKAYQTALKKGTLQTAEYISFLKQQSAWLSNYALFMALKDHFHGESWEHWEQDIRLRKPKALASFQELLVNRSLSSRQWKKQKF